MWLNILGSPSPMIFYSGDHTPSGGTSLLPCGGTPPQWWTPPLQELTCPVLVASVGRPCPALSLCNLADVAVPVTHAKIEQLTSLLSDDHGAAGFRCVPATIAPIQPTSVHIIHSSIWSWPPPLAIVAITAAPFTSFESHVMVSMLHSSSQYSQAKIRMLLKPRIISLWREQWKFRFFSHSWPSNVLLSVTWCAMSTTRLYFSASMFLSKPAGLQYSTGMMCRSTSASL